MQAPLWCSFQCSMQSDFTTLRFDTQLQPNQTWFGASSNWVPHPKSSGCRLLCSDSDRHCLSLSITHTANAYFNKAVAADSRRHTCLACLSCCACIQILLACAPLPALFVRVSFGDNAIPSASSRWLKPDAACKTNWQHRRHKYETSTY